MQTVIKIRNLDCPNCARELQELLERTEGISSASVDFLNQRIALFYTDGQALARAEDVISHFEDVEIVRESAGGKVIHIRNLHCANCALELQEELCEIEGITQANVDFINQRVTLAASSQTAWDKAIYLISHFEKVQIIDENAPPRKERHLKEVVSVAVALLFFIPALIFSFQSGYEWLSLGLFLAAFAAAGWSVVLSVLQNIPRAFKNGFHGGVLLDENTLMLIASIGAFVIGEWMEGAAVMLLYQIGEYLQALAVGSSRNAITKLVKLKSDSAIRLTEEGQEEVMPEALAVGDTVLIRRGDKVAVDCTLIEGATQLDTKSLTGEAYLREVSAGDEMLAGSVNEGNAVKAQVLRAYSDSAVAKILNMVENATSQKAKPEKFITRFARFYTPIVVCIALLVAVIPPLFDGYNFTRWVLSALNFLVISCPCALIISVPLTYFSGIGRLAREGILSKGAVYLDTLASVKTVAFDKTGTLTEGEFSVVGVKGEERALPLAAAVEKLSAHPLAQAFAEVETPYTAENCREHAGMGLSATVDGKRVLVGSLRLMQAHQIKVQEVYGVASVVYVAEEGEYLGCIFIEDKLKEEVHETLTSLKELGVGYIAVLTGDTQERAEELLKTLPIDEICAHLMPEEKPERAQALKERGTLLYVGDGINDTPVMTVSDLALSMGKLGSDAAIEASDMVLVSDRLSALPKAFKVAKKTRKIVFENIVFSIAVKAAFMVLSLCGVLPLWLAVLADVGVMLLAVLNSMRMRLKIK